MPNRTILNKFGLFVSQVHKILKKKSLDSDDFKVINEARLVAALSSNHSWRVYRFMHERDTFDRNAIRDEVNAAYNEGWKEISENDLKEVVTSNLEDHALSQVLSCGALEKNEVKDFKDLLPRLLQEFEDGIEPIESREI